MANCQLRDKRFEGDAAHVHYTPRDDDADVCQVRRFIGQHPGTYLQNTSWMACNSSASPISRENIDVLAAGAARSISTDQSSQFTTLLQSDIAGYYPSSTLKQAPIECPNSAKCICRRRPSLHPYLGFATRVLAAGKW